MANTALANIQSMQHNNKWYEFTKSSLIPGKFPEKTAQTLVKISKSELKQSFTFHVHKQGPAEIEHFTTAARYSSENIWNINFSIS